MTRFHRRDVLKQMLFGFLALPFLKPAYSATSPTVTKLKYSKHLSIYNTHTRESLSVRYLDSKKKFIPEALNQLNHHFRCHYKDQVVPIDPKLYLLLDAVHTRLEAGEKPFHLVSGFRSPEYNALLRKKSRGVAKKSYHLLGKAADVRIIGYSENKIRKAAQTFKLGGVGCYPEFIHLDTGPVRSW